MFIVRPYFSPFPSFINPSEESDKDRHLAEPKQ